MLLLVATLPAVIFTLKEMQHRPLTRAAVAAPALLAAFCAMLFLLLHQSPGQPEWTFIVALLAGLLIGILRGFTLTLQFDHTFAKLRFPRARGSFLVALGPVGAVLLEIGGAFASGGAGYPFRMIALQLAAFCAGGLFGRAVAVLIRCYREPHVDLHRM